MLTCCFRYHCAPRVLLGVQFHLLAELGQKFNATKEKEMKVVLTDRQERSQCVWCERERETVTVTFSDGLFKDDSICWKCLQQAFKVRCEALKARAGAPSANESEVNPHD